MPPEPLRVVPDEPSAQISTRTARSRAVIPELARVATGGRPTYATQDGLLIYADTGVYEGARPMIRSEVARHRGPDYSPREGESVFTYLRDTSPEWKPDYRTDCVNTPNGLVYVPTLQLFPHTPDLRTTIQIDTPFDPKATAPHFEKYLAGTLPIDMHPRVLEWLGLLLVPDVSHQKAVFLYGDGSNGKSVMISVVLALLGWRSCSFVTLHQLGENRFALAKARDKLANIAGETEGRELRSTAVFKEWVSGAPQIAEHKHGQLFDFQPVARMMLAGNALPATADLSHGFHRRLDIWPFERRFREHEIDRDLHLKLAAERSGILNLALEGLRRLQAQRHFSSSATIDAAGARYRLAVDTVASFVDEACVIGPDESIKGAQLFAAYRRHCEATGKKFRAQVRFYDQLSELFPDDIQRTNPQGAAFFRGIGLRYPA